MPKCKKRLCLFKAHVQSEDYQGYCCDRCAERDSDSCYVLDHYEHGPACGKEVWYPTPPHSPRQLQVHHPSLRSLADANPPPLSLSLGVAGTARFGFDGKAYAEQTEHYGIWYLTFEKGAELELKSYDARHQGWALGILPANANARPGWFPFPFYQNPDVDPVKVLGLNADADALGGATIGDPWFTEAPLPRPSERGEISSSWRSSSNRTLTPTRTSTPTPTAIPRATTPRETAPLSLSRLRLLLGAA